LGCADSYTERFSDFNQFIKQFKLISLLQNAAMKQHLQHFAWLQNSAC